jgi:hypothetical protein
MVSPFRLCPLAMISSGAVSRSTQFSRAVRASKSSNPMDLNGNPPNANPCAVEQWSMPGTMKRRKKSWVFFNPPICATAAS